MRRPGPPLIRRRESANRKSGLAPPHNQRHPPEHLRDARTGLKVPALSTMEWSDVLVERGDDNVYGRPPCTAPRLQRYAVKRREYSETQSGADFLKVFTYMR